LQITDLVVPEIFTPYVQQLTEEKSRLIQSGATTVNPILSNFLSGGGLTVDVPSFKDLDNEEENIPTDDPADSIIASYQGGTPTDANRKDSVPKKTGTSTEIAVRISRNQSWSAADLAADLAGADPMGSIASRVAKYWALRFQAIFVATTNGIIKANVAANGGDFQNDVSGAAFADGVTNFSAEAFIDAAATMGDSSDDLSLMMTHSVVMARKKFSSRGESSVFTLSVTPLLVPLLKVARATAQARISSTMRTRGPGFIPSASKFRLHAWSLVNSRERGHQWPKVFLGLSARAKPRASRMQRLL
jgi:hypothetical protein